MGRSKRGLFAALVGAVAVSAPVAPVAAQVPDTTRADSARYRIQDITVRASRPITTVGGASAIELRMDSLRLFAAPTLEQVLRELPAFHIRTNSRGEAEVSVRGSESRQVAVLMDGVPLTLGWDGRTDVSVVPATAPQTITLVRGLSSILYGPNVLGGIVEMDVGQSRITDRRTSLRLSAGVDQVGGYSSSATFSAPFSSGAGRWLLRAGAGLRDSPGFPLPRGVSEPVATDDDLRLNTDAQNIDGFLSLRYEDDGGSWLSLSGSGYRAERGIAAELGAQDPRLWRYPSITRTIAVASGGTGDRATPLGRGDLEVSLGLDIGRTEIESYTSRAYSELDGFENGDDRTLTARLLGDHTLGERADLRTAFTFADILHDSDVDGELATYQQRLWSLGGETLFRLVDGGLGPVNDLRLSVGAALDRAATPQSGDLPALDALTDWGARAGLTAVVSDGDVLLHAGASRRVRFPALRELYSEAIDRFEPNPELQPERLFALEAGATVRVGDGELQVVGFRHRLAGAIRRIGLEDGRRKRVNADRLLSTGVEVIFSRNFGPLGLSGDVTLQAVDLRDPGSSISGEPENLPEIEGGIRALLPIRADLAASFQARVVGSQFCLDPDTGGDRRLDAGARLGARLTKTWSLGSGGAGPFSNLETSVFAENLGDVALYDQCGLPRAGRILGVQLTVF